jgi:hypothetical protein
VTRESFIRYMQSQRRDLHIDWEFIEGVYFRTREPGPPMLSVPVETLEWMLSIGLQADLEDGVEGTEDACFVLELAWCFDRFLLRGTQVGRVSLEAHVKERLRLAMVATRGGEDCKSALSLGLSRY